MKPKDVSTSVVDHDGQLYVNITFRLPGSLPREEAPNQFRVKESARKHKQKAITHIVQEIEFE
jgi:hypothetical protein